MSKQWMAILVGGLLPALFLGISGVFQKTASRTGIAPGVYLLVIGSVLAVVGAVVTLVQRETSVTIAGALHTAGFALLWSCGVIGIMLGLGRYEGQVSVIVPLYNMNTLVAVALGLILLGEWEGVNTPPASSPAPPSSSPEGCWRVRRLGEWSARVLHKQGLSAGIGSTLRCSLLEIDKSEISAKR